MISSILKPLITQGLSLIGNAVLAKGKDWVEAKTGVKLGEEPLSEDNYLLLKQFEMEHEEELIKLRQEDDKLSAEIEKAYLADTQSARTMQVAALKQDDIFSKRFIYYFAIFWALFAVVYISCITFLTIPESNVRFADTILGFVLGTIIAQIVSFFFGSSRSSQAKDEVIRHAVTK